MPTVSVYYSDSEQYLIDAATTGNKKISTAIMDTLRDKYGAEGMHVNLKYNFSQGYREKMAIAGKAAPYRGEIQCPDGLHPLLKEYADIGKNVTTINLTDGCFSEWQKTEGDWRYVFIGKLFFDGVQTIDTILSFFRKAKTSLTEDEKRVQAKRDTAVAKERAAAESAKQEEATARVAALAEIVTQRKSWVEANGSSYLKGLIAGGYDYRDQLEKEWLTATQEGKELQFHINLEPDDLMYQEDPSEKELDTLNRAAKIYPDATCKLFSSADGRGIEIMFNVFSGTYYAWLFIS